MQALRAAIVVTPDADRTVAGIPLLARTVLTLVTSGVPHITVIDPQGSRSSVHASARAYIARAVPTARIDWIGANDPDPNTNPECPVIVAPTIGVFGTQLIGNIFKQTQSRPARLIVSEQNETAFWLLNAQDYDAFRQNNSIDATTVALSENDFVLARNAAEAERAERALFRWCIKETDGVVSRHLNRPISTFISRKIAHTTIKPTQLTGVTAICALAMFAALSGGTPFLIGLGCILYHITSVIDGLDGEIARAKFMSSARGAKLDTAVDMATNLLFFIGISIGNAHALGPIYGWLGIYVAVIAMIAIATMTLTLKFGPGGGSFDVLQLAIRNRLRENPVLSRAFGFINAIFKRDFFAFAFAILGITGHANVIPWFLAIGVTIWLGAIVSNMSILLGSSKDDVLPSHLREAKIPTASAKTPG